MAEKAGFCAGVKKAVALALAAAKQGLIYSLGPLAHNEHLIRHLAIHGVPQGDDLAEVPEGATVIIRTHGVRPEVLQAAAERGLNIINATCVFVQKLQQQVADLIEAGQQVVIVGARRHPEVQGVLGWGRDQPFVVQSPEEVSQLQGLDVTRPVAVVAQTTQQVSILDEIVEKLKELVPVVYIYNTICNATALRQQAASDLAQKVDAMVVIGSKSSSNTQKLAAICRAQVSGLLRLLMLELDAAQLQGGGQSG